MSAKVYAPPNSVHVPDFDESMVNGRYSMEKDQEVSDKFLNDLRAWLRANNFTGKAAGEVVRWPRADGYAQYMVMKLRPLILIHLPLHDAWSMDDIFLRGLTAKDVTDAIDRQKAMKALFSRKDTP